MSDVENALKPLTPPPKESEESLDAERKEAAANHRKFRRAQWGKKVTATLVGGLTTASAFLSSSNSPDGSFHPGVDRWETKTSIQTNKPFGEVKSIEITELEVLKPPVFTGKKSDFDSALIPGKVGSQEFQEGQMVSTKGYIHLVAFEKGDSDYHIQMNEKPTNQLGDLTPCVVVEIPHPMATQDPILRQQYAEARKFIRDTCFSGKAPTGEVKDVPPPRVEVVGQLFYDLHHHSTDPNNPGGGRGKQLRTGLPMKATTIWEIHPVVKISLAED